MSLLKPKGQPTLSDQMKLKKEKAVSDRKMELIGEFEEQRRLNDIYSTSNFPANNEFVALLNDLRTRNLNLKHHLLSLNGIMEEFPRDISSLNLSSPKSLLAKSAIQKSIQSNISLPQCDDIDEEMRKKNQEIESSIEIQGSLQAMRHVLKAQINKTQTECLGLKKLLSISEKKFDQIQETGLVARKKQTQSEQSLQLVVKAYEQIESQKQSFKFKKMRMKQKIQEENDVENNGLASLQLRIEELRQQEQGQIREIQRLEDQESQLMIKMIDSKHIVQWANGLISLEEIFLQESDSDVANAIDNYQKSKTMSSQMSINVNKVDRRNALSYKPTDALQAESQKIDRKSIIRKTFSFFDTHPKGAVELCDRIITAFRRILVIHQSHEQRYQELLEEKKQRNGELEQMNSVIEEVEIQQLHLLHISLEGKGLAFTDDEHLQKHRNRMLHHQITEINTPLESVLTLDGIMPQEIDLETENEGLMNELQILRAQHIKEMAIFKEEFEVRQRFLLFIYYSLIEMVNRFHQLNKNVLSCQKDPDVILDKLCKETQILSEKLKFGLKMKKKIDLKTIQFESTFSQQLTKIQYIPLERNEIIEQFLSFFPNQMNKSMQWAELLKQNILVQIVISKPELDEYLEEFQTRIPDHQQAGQLALEGISQLLDRSLNEFQQIIKRLIDQSSYFLKSFTKSTRIRKTIPVKSSSIIFKEARQLAYEKPKAVAIEEIDQPTPERHTNPFTQNFEIHSILSDLVKKERVPKRGVQYRQPLQKVKNVVSVHQRKISQQEDAVDYYHNAKSLLDNERAHIKSSMEQLTKQIPDVRKPDTAMTKVEYGYTLKKILADFRVFEDIKRLESLTFLKSTTVHSRESMSQFVPAPIRSVYRQSLEQKRRSVPTSKVQEYTQLPHSLHSNAHQKMGKHVLGKSQTIIEPQPKTYQYNSNRTLLMKHQRFHLGFSENTPKVCGYVSEQITPWGRIDSPLKRSTLVPRFEIN